jgi:hypothetical protein
MPHLAHTHVNVRQIFLDEIVKTRSADAPQIRVEMERRVMS